MSLGNKLLIVDALDKNGKSEIVHGNQHGKR
jgi:hypothetical protein